MAVFPTPTLISRAGSPGHTILLLGFLQRDTERHGLAHIVTKTDYTQTNEEI